MELSKINTPQILSQSEVQVDLPDASTAQILGIASALMVCTNVTFVACILAFFAISMGKRAKKTFGSK